ncbi:MAG: biotin--[acetyl-CoA-carboxylase] ligase [Candidatus Eisenbacteria bacterium]|uniref:biotin--[biotin carboxyl-carrier protein] ligase n=1 Tax=Eiseniibacteriota bacterium TaxID=2212470 RepID=A0A538UAL6_UNCEI|nr:MAG: biotin--[acetyl-CoA-carboxylase] ligase [Candidatus Eisenbacteria bacterium]
MAEPTFDRRAFERLLTTRRLGRTLIARAETPSTNDLAWEALAAGTGDGTVVVSDAQPAGRGREGRGWHLTPGKGLALSLVLHTGCDRRQTGLLPLVAGLALARALERLGVTAALKWPNDLLVDGRKLSGILCESRRLANGAEAAVIGVGVNVSQQRDDFPPALRATATSLALEGCRAPREAVAATFLGALEPLWAGLEERGRAWVIEAWTRRASFWGAPVTVRTPAGPVTGVARRLSDDGGLTLGLADGTETVVLAGDLEVAGRGEAP